MRGHTLKLLLIRHAKSSWDDLTLDDHDRPLNDRGQAAAIRVGTWLNAQGHTPKHVICSTAARAVQTCELIVAQMDESPEIDFESTLYHASPDVILNRVRHAPTGDLMVVGHNPGMAHFADVISETRPKHERFTIFPTTSTLISEVAHDSWEALKFGDAKLINFIVPRELKGLV